MTVDWIAIALPKVAIGAIEDAEFEIICDADGNDIA